MAIRHNLIGRVFGRLTVTSMLPDGKCMCDCACGKSGVSVFQSNISTGRTVSCGCHRVAATSARTKRHGDSESVEHRTFCWMHGRCYCPTNPKFSDYGGRGIIVCPRWHLYENFIADMGRKPSKRHSIHRVDNDGIYEPGNCEWALPKTQSRETRRSFKVTAFGKTATIAEWSETTGIKYGTIWSRIVDYGWKPERAVGTIGDARC